jgi:hypothetical protein
MSQFEQWVNINSFHKLGKSAVETLINHNAVYGDTLKNVLCITDTTDLKKVMDHYKMRSTVAGQQQEEIVKVWPKYAQWRHLIGVSSLDI